jgi:anti-sigma regulatory factor (Ser/Thr protein kinase)
MRALSPRVPERSIAKPPKAAGLRLRPEPRSVAPARQWITRQLRGWRLHCDRDTARLLLSELVTNAVLHGSDAGEIRVQIAASAGRLHVEVHNSPRGQDPIRSCGEEHEAMDEDGRGLLLVESLAEFWGVLHGPEETVVFFAIKARLPIGRHRPPPTGIAALATQGLRRRTAAGSPRRYVASPLRRDGPSAVFREPDSQPRAASAIPLRAIDAASRPAVRSVSQEPIPAAAHNA